LQSFGFGLIPERQARLFDYLLSAGFRICRWRAASLRQRHERDAQSEHEN
jgi:hypothetical protein